jgi:Ca-activated chloride channel family protein
MTHTHFFGTLVGLRAIRPWVVIAFCAAVLVSACAPSAVRHNRHGNVHFADGAYADAIEAYRLAQIADSEKAEPFYNAANAYNRNAQLSATLAQTQQALRTANAELAAKAWYNLGNAYFDAQQWTEAIDAYQSALRIDPADLDAKHNLELALQQEEPAQDGFDVDSSNQDNRTESAPTAQPGADSSQGSQEELKAPTQPTNDGPPIQTPSPQQARQLLEALVGNGETLQERLQKTFRVRERPPDRDW